MAYTLKQLTMAWTAVHDGIAPDAATVADLENKVAQVVAGAMTDAQALGWVLNSADKTTALAALSYQFFTGKSPTQEGLAYLVNSPDNAADLNDAYYGKFNIENRYINFSANLGVQGEGAGAFAGKYGSMSFADYIASIYETIIGSTYAKAAGVDIPAAIAYLVSREDAIKATAQGAGMITPNMTQAQIDLAVKAAAAGFLMGEAIKSDIGLYAGAANNFMLALAMGTATYNTDLTTTYKPSDTQGIGQPVTTAPPASTLPGAPPPPPPEPDPEPLHFTLTNAADTFAGDSQNDTFTATDDTFSAGDRLSGGGGADTLTITGSTGGSFTAPATTLTGIETVTISNNDDVTVDTTVWTGVTQLNVTTSGGGQRLTADATTDITLTSSGGNGIVTNGGRNVTMNVTNTNTITMNTAASGAVTANISASATNNGTHVIRAGGDITVTQTATNAVNTTIGLAQIVTYGGAATHAVVIHNSVSGVTPAQVVITDVNGSTSATGVITSIDVEGYSGVSITDSGLTTLRLAHGSGMVTLTNGFATAPATTLNLSLDDVTGGNAITDNNKYTTLNITNAASASDVAFQMYGVTDVTIAGAGSLTADISATDLQTLKVTGSTSLTTTIDGAVTKLTTGSGDDTLTIDGATISKAIAAGAGDDTVIVSNANATITAAIDGGAGTHDVLTMSTAAAVAASAAGGSLITGFEVLSIGALANGVIDTAALGGVSWVKTSGDGTINGLASGSTLELTDGGSLLTLGATGFAGANDSLDVLLSGPAPTTFRTYSDIDSSGIETLNLQVDQPDHVPSAFSYLEWRSGDLQTLNVTGSGNLDVLMSNRSNLTLVDASAFDGSISFYGVSSATPITILGSAHGENSFRLLGSGTVTYTGGDGEDTVTVARGAHQIDVGTGDDTVVFTSANTVAAYASITGLGDAGDRLGINLGGLTNGSATQITGYTDLASYADAASASTTGGSTPVAHWFELDDDAYVVVDFNDSATYTNGWGLVVKLTGMAGHFSGALNIVNGYIEF